MNRDTELQRLLSKLQETHPTSEQIERWNKAILIELSVKRPRNWIPVRWVAQMAAVLATGFLLGVLYSKNNTVSQENHEPVATVQYTFSKSE